MAHKEIYIQISAADENELFKYITQICHCRVLVPITNNSENAFFKEEGLADSRVYIIVNENIQMNYKSDAIEIPYGFSYISYEKIDDVDKDRITVRLFTTYEIINKKNSMAGIYDAIKKWIKSHTQEIDGFGKFKTYIIKIEQLDGCE